MTNEQAINILKHHINTWKGKFAPPHFEACDKAIEALESKLQGDSAKEHRTFYDMNFKEILALTKKYKMQAIQLLIESIVDDKEKDIIAFYETEMQGTVIKQKDIDVVRMCLQTMQTFGNEKSKKDIGEALLAFNTLIKGDKDDRLG